jgi:hypothetical protein
VSAKVPPRRSQRGARRSRHERGTGRVGGTERRGSLLRGHEGCASSCDSGEAMVSVRKETCAPKLDRDGY